MILFQAICHDSAFLLQYWTLLKREQPPLNEPFIEKNNLEWKDPIQIPCLPLLPWLHI